MFFDVIFFFEKTESLICIWFEREIYKRCKVIKSLFSYFLYVPYPYTFTPEARIQYATKYYSNFND